MHRHLIYNQRDCWFELILPPLQVYQLQPTNKSYLTKKTNYEHENHQPNKAVRTNKTAALANVEKYVARQCTDNRKPKKHNINRW
ncbi:hypothetical protein SRABI27_04867 [Pedobacter sp. Bi27]|nr:hypothetical protein SRABI36_04758 [Pedobacter sp. Bi36]CAH0312995.1 hypothetical protein SRABI27_04867 [Pedobacter sp. Bi27]CAH0313549.1 hypothetical protein SRABI126_04882 [Pedobacter sp. Bi126]